MRRFRSSVSLNSFSFAKRFSSTATCSSATASSEGSFQYQAGRALGILLPFAAVWAASSYFFQPQEEKTTDQVTIIQPSNTNNTNNNGAMLGGPFQMIDCSSNKVVTDKDIFSTSTSTSSSDDNVPNTQRWSLLYFGFTKCAEVCPRNLKFMTSTLESLKTGKADWQDKVQIVFVSVDPIRDKPDVLNQYLREKVPDGIRWKGLCGSEEQVSSICRSWRVYYSSMNESDEEKAAREAKGLSLEDTIGSNNENYQLDHSAAVYFVAPGGKLRDLFFDEMGVKHAADRIDLHLSGAYSGLNQI